MPDHDTIRFITELSAKLAARSRHICMLLGAGTSRACGLPDVALLQKQVLDGLTGNDRENFARQLKSRNLEQALSRLRRIVALVSGNETVDGFTAEQASELDKAVCREIVKKLDIQKADLAPVYKLAAWARRSGYRLPVELFTVNYDLLLETALESMRVPYFDGFIGSLRARFHTELVEASDVGGECVPSFFVRLWKLHGSVNWLWEDGQQIVRVGYPVTDGQAAAIYPSDAKYEESRRVPFLVLQDRFRRALQHPESLVLIAGYSFSDDHLNELIFDAAARRERSEFVAFCYSELPDVLAARAETTPNLQAITGREAILGGLRANWKAPENPPPDLWEEDQLALRDFKHLAAYLARSTIQEPEAHALLRSLLEGTK